MEFIKVSVIVPIYNVIKYVHECIRSLLNQTLQEIEIILVDDGSTDGSGEVCDKYSKEYERVRVVHKENGGLGSARNTGLQVAKGEYVYFIDGDDSLKHNALEILYYKAKRDELDILLFSAECFSDEVGIKYNANEYKRIHFLNEVFSGKELFLKLNSVSEYYTSIPLRLYKTSYLQSKDYIFPEHIIHEDEIYAYWSLIQAERVECISDRFYNRRFRAGSIITSGRAFNSAVGCTYTWCKMIGSMSELEGWSEAEKCKVIEFANYRISVAMNYYAYSFDAKDRKKYKAEISNLRQIMHEHKEVIASSRRLKLFYICPAAYRLYMRAINIRPRIRASVQERKKTNAFKLLLDEIAKGKSDGNTHAILIGTPTHGNLGDQAIVLAENKMLGDIFESKRVFEISSSDYLKYADELQEYIPEQDIIVIDGGGSMGTLWVNNEFRFRDVVKRFPNNRIYIFPQTVFYGENEWETKVLADSKAVYDNHTKLTIFCRDRLSFEFVKTTFTKNKVLYTPDMVLSLFPCNIEVERENKVLVCLRDDIEGIVRDEDKELILSSLKLLDYEIASFSTIISKYVDSNSREEELKDKWKEISKAKLVVTDRLHAMIFCALTGTPCIALNNRSFKVEGTYDWIKDLPYIYLQELPFDIDREQMQELITHADEYGNLELVNNKFIQMRNLIEENEKADRQ